MHLKSEKPTRIEEYLHVAERKSGSKDDKHRGSNQLEVQEGDKTSEVAAETELIVDAAPRNSGKVGEEPGLQLAQLALCLSFVALLRQTPAPQRQGQHLSQPQLKGTDRAFQQAEGPLHGGLLPHTQALRPQN